MRGPDGEPVTTASIAPLLVGRNTNPYFHTEGETGRIDIEGLIPGTYKLAVYAPDAAVLAEFAADREEAIGALGGGT